MVADEVRKLAEKTMTATQEVGRAIGGIQDGTRKNIANVESVAAAIESAADLSAHSGQSLQQILALVAQVNDRIQSIAAASEQQSATSEEVNRSVEQVAAASTETVQAMEQATHAVEGLTQQALVLQTLIADLEKQDNYCNSESSCGCVSSRSPWRRKRSFGRCDAGTWPATKEGTGKASSAMQLRG